MRMLSQPGATPSVSKPATLTAVLLAFALATSACSLVLETDRHRSDAEPVPATQFCGQLATLGCEAVRDCCAQPDLDVASCAQDAAVNCASDFGALGIDPRTGYDDGQAGLALAEARTLVASCDPALYAWSTSSRGFRRTLAGTVPYGGSCDPGLSETAALLSCADDGVCSLVGLDWVCVAPVARGEECTFDAACEPGLRCTAIVQLLGTGACQPLKAVGVACTRDTECETNLCDSTCREATQDEAFCSG